MKKPIKPRAPIKPIEPVAIKKVRAFACLEEMPLLDFLEENFPGVPLESICIESEEHDYYDFYVLAFYGDMENIHYSKEMEKYRIAFRAFEERLALYKIELVQYNEEMDKYTEFKRSEEKDKLLKRLKELE